MGLVRQRWRTSRRSAMGSCGRGVTLPVRTMEIGRLCESCQLCWGRHRRQTLYCAYVFNAHSTHVSRLILA